MNSKAALYIRVSTDEQAEKGTSLSSQEERLREFCSRNGIEVAGVYRDDGYSGATLDRPDLQRMLQDARRSVFGRVLVFKLDRLSRNLKDAVNLVLGELKDGGIDFQSITEPFNTLDPSGRVMFANLASFADYEREQIRERCNRGRIMRTREGRFTGGRLPYGISWNRDAKTFAVCEDEARICQRIYELFIKGRLSLGQIALRLNGEGCVTRGGTAFSARHIRELLDSQAMYGEWHRHRVVNRTASDPLVQRNLRNQAYDKRGERPREEWITIHVPPIISKETWDRAQELLASRSRGPRSVQTALCQGLLYCGECGSRMGVKNVGRDRKVYRLYGCYARLYKSDQRYRQYRGHGCDMPFVPQHEVDELVWGKVEELVTNPAVLWDAVYGGGDRGGQETLDRRMEGIRRQLSQAKAQEDRAARLFTLGADPQTAERQVKEASARRRALEQELLQAEKAARMEDARRDLKEKAIESLGTLRERVGSLTPEEKRRNLIALVPGGLTYRIVLHKDRTITMSGLLEIGANAGSPYSTVCY